MKIQLAPSILTADFGNLAVQIRRLEEGGADSLHLDIMDGRFVPNLTFGPPVVASLRKITRLPFDIHLMVQEPERFLEAFAGAGGNSLTVHAESSPHLHRVVKAIKGLGLKAGVALNPATPLHALEFVLEEVDLVLLMTVNPGWGGQEFIPQMLRKIKKLRKRILRARLPVEIQVDGGINRATLAGVVAAGADHLVIGSALFNEEDPGKALQEYRSQAEGAFRESWWGNFQDSEV
ncbi:MAG: ribulose-phosphate 3-epimerase [Firmicutes bacterium]|nr:ribulose-phosphate 3-epimerase [Bacillota bacterium]